MRPPNPRPGFNQKIRETFQTNRASSVLNCAPPPFIAIFGSLASIYCPGLVGVLPESVTRALLLEILVRDALARMAAKPES
jgi:hypothetical protein